MYNLRNLQKNDRMYLKLCEAYDYCDTLPDGPQKDTALMLAMAMQHAHEDFLVDMGEYEIISENPRWMKINR